MKFSIHPGQPQSKGKVLYKPNEYAFDFEPRIESGVTSLLVNDLQLEIDDEGRVLYPWGYCPHLSWQKTEDRVPHHLPGVLKVALDEEIIPGVSIQVTPEAGWPVYVNHETGWVHIGQREELPPIADAIEFASDSVAAIVDGAIVAVWLRPETVPRSVGE